MFLWLFYILCSIATPPLSVLLRDIVVRAGDGLLVCVCPPIVSEGRREAPPAATWFFLARATIRIGPAAVVRAVAGPESREVHRSPLRRVEDHEKTLGEQATVVPKRKTEELKKKDRLEVFVVNGVFLCSRSVVRRVWCVCYSVMLVCCACVTGVAACSALTSE